MLRRLRPAVGPLVRSPVAAGVLVVVLCVVLVVGLRASATLEALELAAYDWYMRLQPADPPPDPRILLVRITEGDIRAQGRWPLSDGVLAQTLTALSRYEPSAIGLDLYRDVAVPPGTDELDRAFASDRRIIGVMKFGEGTSSGVGPPPVLKERDQVGFNDVLVDPGGTVRRGLLFVDDGTTSFSSFPLRLALLYLEAEGVVPQADPRDPNRLRLGATSIRPLERNDGAYVGADAGGYQFLLDFKGARRPFASVSLTELLAGHIEPAAVRGKVVLVGVVAESVKDDFYIPYSRGRHAGQQMSGVAVHAQVVSQLLRIGLNGDAPMAAPGKWAEVAWIAVGCLVGGVVGFKIRSPWWFSLAVVTGLLGLGLSAFVAFAWGWWLPLVPPAIGWVLSATIVMATVSYQTARERGVLMQLFSRHVSREVAESIWQHRDQFVEGGRPRSQRCVVTALFTDLTGFTTVSERLAPEVLLDWLNEYMDAMAPEVSRQGGVIKQYAGDSIVAIFGVPVARMSEAEVAQDAVNAVNCALGMEEGLLALNRDWLRQGRPITGMRIGIFTGPVVVGTLGSAVRSEYVAVGDTVNTASRLESFDKDMFAPDPEKHPCRILIGESTVRYLGDRFVTEHVGDVSLKGKEQKVRIYRVIGRAPAPDQVVTEEAPQ
jgi:adenylate cyclase